MGRRRLGRYANPGADGCPNALSVFAPVAGAGFSSNLLLVAHAQRLGGGAC